MLVVAPFLLGVLAGFAIKYFAFVVPIATFVYVGLTVTDLEANSWKIAIAAAAISAVGVAVGVRTRRGYDHMRRT